jgi:eukaryotic-like serine/threonine-protein kinase
VSLTPGTRLGPYEVTAQIGSGGMGEVYRARDTKLGRDVALKLLPESFAADPDRRMRFEREAKTLATLNHPNIAAIYGLEDRALIMELVEGEDLSQQIARGAMPVREVLPVARQLAEALEAAHEAGIIHRDLKPANVKVRPDGTVKVLDFGLAKAIAPVADGSGIPSSPASSPTMTSPALTALGLILGTAAYMSPEQAKGKPVDRRADIWAFGVMLCEMLTGRRLFDADNITETLAAVLTRDVSITALPVEIPAGLRTLIADCLIRDPKKRLRDVGDARLRLEKLDDLDGNPAEAAVATRPSGLHKWLWPGVAALSALGGVAATWVLINRPAPGVPDGITFEIAAEAGAVMSLSPDGRHVAHGTVSSDAGPGRIWVRSLSSFDSRAVAGTDGAVVRGRYPAIAPGLVWSPDSRSIVFVTPSGLSRVDVSSGQTTELVKILQSFLTPGAWGRDGVILFGRRGTLDGGDAGIWRLPETGGSPVQVTGLRQGHLTQRPTGFLPDGRRFLYISFPSSGEDAEVRVGSVDRQPAEQDAAVLLSADGPAVYVSALDPFGQPAATGYVLFVRRGSLMAQAFDPGPAKLTDTMPVQIASGVAPAVYASNNGSLLYRPITGADALQSELIRFDRKGAVVTRIGPPALYNGLTALADGARLAVSRKDTGDVDHLFVVDVTRGVFSRLNPGTASDFAAAAARDHLLAYTYSPEGVSRDLWVRQANGVGDARLLAGSANIKHANDWSPDGQFLIYDEHVAGRAQDLLLIRRDGGAAIPYLTTEADETFAQFSRDGKWIAYRSTESGRPEVFVRDFRPDRTPPYGTEKIQISVTGGDKPRWSRDGREIFFLQGTMLMAVPFGTGTPPTVGVPVKLFDLRPNSYIPYDVMPDGTFVVNAQMEAGKPLPAALRVIVNWETMLKK